MDIVIIRQHGKKKINKEIPFQNSSLSNTQTKIRPEYRIRPVWNHKHYCWSTMRKVNMGVLLGEKHNELPKLDSSWQTKWEQKCKMLAKWSGVKHFFRLIQIPWKELGWILMTQLIYFAWSDIWICILYNYVKSSVHNKQ